MSIQKKSLISALKTTQKANVAAAAPVAEAGKTNTSMRMQNVSMKKNAISLKKNAISLKKNAISLKKNAISLKKNAISLKGVSRQ
jgi:hypothetical protein